TSNDCDLVLLKWFRGNRTLIEPQLARPAAAVRSVASEAVLRQDRANVPIEIDRCFAVAILSARRTGGKNDDRSSRNQRTPEKKFRRHQLPRSGSRGEFSGWEDIVNIPRDRGYEQEGRSAIRRWCVAGFLLDRTRRQTHNR